MPPPNDPAQLNQDIDNPTGDVESASKLAKKPGEESDVDSSQLDPEVESEEAPEGEEVPARSKQLFWAKKESSRRYEDIFDEYYNIEEQMAEY